MFKKFLDWFLGLFKKKEPTETKPEINEEAKEPEITEREENEPDPLPLENIKYREEYENLIASMTINTEKKGTVDWYINYGNKFIEKYKEVSKVTGVPYQIIFCIHALEAGFSMDSVLHNGEKIIGTGKKTTLVPKGRGPFTTWEEAAIDAFEYDGLTKIKNWDGPTALYCLEKYNGFGYRNKGINSPYLWSFTNHYTKGKYVSDGKFDPNAVSAQCGGAVILKSLGYFDD